MVRRFFVALFLLSMVETGFAQDKDISGKWRLSGEPARLAGCPVDFDMIEVGEQSISIRAFHAARTSSRYRETREWLRGRLLEELQTENDGLVQSFVDIKGYNGCLRHTAYYARSLDGSLRKLPYEFDTSQERACFEEYTYGGNPAGTPDSLRTEKEKNEEREFLEWKRKHLLENPSVATQLACAEKYIFDIWRVRRLNREREELVVVNRDNLILRFQKIEPRK